MSSAYAQPSTGLTDYQENPSFSGQSAQSLEQIKGWARKVYSISKSYLGLTKATDGLSSAEAILSLSQVEEEKLRIVEGLEKGWDGGTAEPVEVVAVQSARELLLSLRSDHIAAQDARVLPIADGRIQLEWHDVDRSLEFEFTRPGWVAMGLDHSDQSAGTQYYSLEIDQLDPAVISRAYDWFVQRDPKIAPWPSR